MKIMFNKEADGSISCQMQTGTISVDFDYVEMLKQLLQNNIIEPEWGNLEEVEKNKLEEMLNKITHAVQNGLANGSQNKDE